MTLIITYAVCRVYVWGEDKHNTMYEIKCESNSLRKSREEGERGEGRDSEKENGEDKGYE